MQEEKIKSAFAKKLAFYRKNMNLTQTELAEKLNYSDKSVSKWERAEGVPDIFVLKQLAEMFSVTVDDLINENTPLRPASISRNRTLITVISGIGTFLFAAVAFAVLTVLGITEISPWVCFLFAVPVCAIVFIVFTAMWWGRWWLLGSVSVFIWSFVGCFIIMYKNVNVLAFLAVAFVLQILCVLFTFIKFNVKR